MSTNLSDNTLTLNNTSLNEETLKAIGNYYIPDNCKAGDTVILDGIECLCVATGVVIQGSNLTRIAVDKNYDLGYYQKYVGMAQGGTLGSEPIAPINVIRYWRWGSYGTELGNTSKEVGYGLQNTINCLANTVNYTKGTYIGAEYDMYPWLWQGVNDFRSSHSDKWFVPSANELLNYVYAYKSSLSFGDITGGFDSSSFWSSSEYSDKRSYFVSFNTGGLGSNEKYNDWPVRLCRAF